MPFNEGQAALARLRIQKLNFSPMMEISLRFMEMGGK